MTASMHSFGVLAVGLELAGYMNHSQKPRSTTLFGRKKTSACEDKLARVEAQQREFAAQVAAMAEAAAAGDFGLRIDLSRFDRDLATAATAANEQAELIQQREVGFWGCLDAIPFLLSITDDQMRLTGVNKPVCDMLGIPARRPSVSSVARSGRAISAIPPTAELRNCVPTRPAPLSSWPSILLSRPRVAGDQGRGFAVVADEVRKLAERASSATKEIESLILGVQRSIHDAAQSMDGSLRQVDSGRRVGAIGRRCVEQHCRRVQCRGPANRGNIAQCRRPGSHDRRGQRPVGRGDGVGRVAASMAGSLTEMVSRFRLAGAAARPPVRPGDSARTTVTAARPAPPSPLSGASKTAVRELVRRG